MRLRSAHDLGPLMQEARRSLGWSQTRLAEAVGVSRQWVSLVENGKTSVEFDLVLESLRALGYAVSVEARQGPGQTIPGDQVPVEAATRDPSGRTPLTRQGRPLGQQRSRHRRDSQDHG
ncbi:MAG: helix-turn-helix domain-containing protein [Gemmatimonadota bacterium]